MSAYGCGMCGQVCQRPCIALVLREREGSEEESEDE